MDSATTVLTGFSVALIVCTVLEAASYYIYNRKVCCVVAQIEIDMRYEQITVKFKSFYFQFHPWILIVQGQGKEEKGKTIIISYHHNT